MLRKAIIYHLNALKSLAPDFFVVDLFTLTRDTVREEGEGRKHMKTDISASLWHM